MTREYVFSPHHHTMPPTNSALYQHFHKSVRADRGQAREYNCVSCGDKACDWAWRHDTDPSDSANYDPMCRLCHQERDRAEWLVEERRQEQARKEQTNAFKGWTPERREAQRQRMLAKWSKPGQREAQSARAIRDKPWLRRRPKNRGDAG